MNSIILVFICILLFEIASHECTAENLNLRGRRRAPRPDECRRLPSFSGGFTYNHSPVAKANGVNYYPNGTTAKLTYCKDDRYRVQEPSEATCRNGAWNRYLRCVPILCPEPNVHRGRYRHATIVPAWWKPKVRYAVESYVTFTCDYRYRTSHQKARVCQKDGTWSRTNPTCILVFCPYIGVENGRVSYSRSRLLDSVLTITCKNGYRLVGEGKLTCGLDDSWNHPTPRCRKVGCKITVPENGLATVNGVRYTESGTIARVGSRIDWRCKDTRWKYRGNEYALCGGNERWTVQHGNCGDHDCFPSISTLQLKNGEVVKMSELQIGDQVKTVSSTGSVQYSYVKAFLKKQPNTISTYLSIKTLHERTITLSKKHLIYTRKSSTDEFNPEFADQVSIGDEVLIEKNDDVMPVKVVNVSSLVLQGVHVPLTEEGNVLVDEVLASCYAVVDHDIGQLAMVPVKWFSETMQMVFGEDGGTPAFINVAKDLRTHV